MTKPYLSHTRVTGETDLLVFEPLPEPVSPGGPYSRIRERIPTATSLTIQQQKGGGFKVSFLLYRYDSCMSETHVEKVTAVVDSLRLGSHKDQTGGDWLDLNGWGRGAQVVINTPTPETWAKLHVWIKIDGRSDVVFDILRLDDQNRELIKAFAEMVGNDG